jgi:hypothetical protein
MAAAVGAAAAVEVAAAVGAACALEAGGFPAHALNVQSINPVIMYRGRGVIAISSLGGQISEVRLKSNIRSNGRVAHALCARVMLRMECTGHPALAAQSAGGRGSGI